VRSKLFLAYAVGQVLAIGLFPLVPLDHWIHVAWQVAVGWTGATFAVIAVRHHRPTHRALFYLFGGGVLLNASGILVYALTGSSRSPSPADPLYLGLYPGVIAGTVLLIRARTVEKDWSTLVDTTIITTGLALLSWVFLVRPQFDHPVITPLERAITLAYPLADMVVLGLMVRLLLGGGTRNGSFRLMVAGMLCFLAADVGWATFTQLHIGAGPFAQRALEMCSLSAYAFIGASLLHPSVHEMLQPGAPGRSRLGPALMVGLTVASLVAPSILLFQALRGHVTDGVAIALSSATLFLLVVARIAQLVRRLQERTDELVERNRAVRLVLDTVNEGLLRISRDGWLAEERSAKIDAWFGGFSARTHFVDYIGRADPRFARSFQLGLQALLEGVLPLELCLDQLPADLRSGGRQYRVSYLTVNGGDQQDGLLIVVNDVTEQVLLTQQEAEQRELVAVLQALARDRLGFLSFQQEADQIVEELVVSASAADRRRHLHTLKGNASLFSLEVVARLCHAAEDAIAEAQPVEAAAPSLEALRQRWQTLREAVRAFVGDRARDRIELSVHEIARLSEEVQGGLAPAAIAQRLLAWRCEPAERWFERLAQNARLLALRLGKGEIEVSLDGGGLSLDPEYWGPLGAEMVHLARNAVDHGFETAAERLAAGKPERPHLRFSASLDATGGLVLELADDGRGIDWEAIRRAAQAQGRPAATPEDLREALFSSGISARTEVTSTSGRGVGMAAVAARVRERNGTIEVETGPGKGTTWRLSFRSERSPGRVDQNRIVSLSRGPARDGSGRSVM
jgi:HPt (histidine-containing phosphotransfer) domain-containing protein